MRYSLEIQCTLSLIRIHFHGVLCSLLVIFRPMYSSPQLSWSGMVTPFWNWRREFFFVSLLFYSLYIYISTYVPENYLNIILYFPERWEFLTYDSSKLLVNFTKVLTILHKIRSKLVRRKLEQVLSIKYEKITGKARQEVLKEGNVYRTVEGTWTDQAVEFLYDYLYTQTKIFCTYSFVDFNLHPHIFCLFLDAPRRFHWLWIWEIRLIFGTTRSPNMMPCRMCVVILQLKTVNLWYWPIHFRDSW